MNANLPSNREDAINQGSVAYFTGEPCDLGHIDKRYTKTKVCYQCKRDRNKRDYDKFTDRVLKSNHKSYRKNKEKRLQGSNRWAEKNREKSREIKRKHKNKFKERYKEYWHNHHKIKRETDPIWRLNKITCRMIWGVLKTKKWRSKLDTLVKFNLKQLLTHMESLFEPEMNWDNYGSYWCVDHIKPMNKCETFEETWELSNLQPLTKYDNAVKGDRWEENCHI